MNVAGLCLITYVFAPPGKVWVWTAWMFVTALATSAGMYFFSPQLSFYVGLSGALHGMIVIGVLRWIQQGDFMGLFVLIIVVAKIAWNNCLALCHCHSKWPVARSRWTRIYGEHSGVWLSDCGA